MNSGFFINPKLKALCLDPTAAFRSLIRSEEIVFTTKQTIANIRKDQRKPIVWIMLCVASE
jgi:hypothetical protein